MSAEAEPDHALLGKLFGFPPCCIEFFTRFVGTGFFRRRHPELRAIGGLRLCPACSRLTNEVIINGIRSRRISPTPFPTAPGPEHFKAIVENEAWTDEERDKLLRQKKFVAFTMPEEEAMVLEFYAGMAAIEASYAADVALTPERQPYLYAKRELAKADLIALLLDKLHAFMRQRIAEQVESGAITL